MGGHFIMRKRARAESAPFTLPKDISMLGGEHGRPPTFREMDRIATILYEEWGPKEPGRTWHDYRCEVSERFRNAKTPIFAAYNSRGEIVAAVFPIRLNDIPGSWLELTGSRSYKNDRKDGLILFCPQIVSICSGMASHLIKEGILPYAAWLHSQNRLKEAFAYSRMAKCRKNREKNPGAGLLELIQMDPTYAYFHYANGAELAFIIENGCPDDPASGGAIFGMRYTHFLSGTPQPREIDIATLSFLKEMCAFPCEIVHVNGLSYIHGRNAALA
jgi:hypothetical protein